jgi:hypothetical protein
MLFSMVIAQLPQSIPAILTRCEFPDAVTAAMAWLIAVASDDRPEGAGMVASSTLKSS